MPKEFDGAAPMAPLAPGENERFDLRGVEHPDERFVLDLGRGRRKATKLKYQTRGRVHLVLARLDVDGAPHTNPDGNTMGGTHLHLFREGWDDRWAVAVDPGDFSDLSEQSQALGDFCRFCRVIDIPMMQTGMF